MKGDRLIAAYVAAVRERDAYRRLLGAYPELLEKRRFMDDMHTATTAATVAHGKLNGGQLARARRILTTPPPQESET